MPDAGRSLQERYFCWLGQVVGHSVAKLLGGDLAEKRLLAGDGERVLEEGELLEPGRHDRRHDVGIAELLEPALEGLALVEGIALGRFSAGSAPVILFHATLPSGPSSVAMSFQARSLFSLGSIIDQPA